MRISAWESSWYEEPIWTKRGGWQRKRDVWTPSTRAGRTPMTGGLEAAGINHNQANASQTMTKHKVHEVQSNTRLGLFCVPGFTLKKTLQIRCICFVMGWRLLHVAEPLENTQIVYVSEPDSNICLLMFCAVTTARWMWCWKSYPRDPSATGS